MMEDESKKVDKWQDKISSGFDRLVAFASTELDKRRRSTESDTAIVGGVDPSASTPTGNSSCNTSPDSGIERDAPPTPSSMNGGHVAPNATPPHLQRQPVASISSSSGKIGDMMGDTNNTLESSSVVSSPGPKMPRLFKSPNLQPTEEECEGFAILLGSPPILEAGMEYDDRGGRVSTGPPRTPSPSNERPPSGPTESVPPPPLTPPYGPDVLDGPYSPVTEGITEEEISGLPRSGSGLWDDWERPPPLMPTGPHPQPDQQFKRDNVTNDATCNGPQYQNDEWSSGDHHFKKKYFRDPWNNTHGDRTCRAKFRPKGKDWDWHGSREMEGNNNPSSRHSFSSYDEGNENLTESNSRHQNSETMGGNRSNIEQHRPSMLEGDSRSGVHSKLLIVPPPHLEVISGMTHQEGTGHYKGDMSKCSVGEQKEGVPRPWRVDGNIGQHIGGPGMHIHHGQAPQYPGAVVTHQHT